MATLPASWRRAPGARPLVLGHRGARHAAPENTLAAFELAEREGADGVELDVRLDGEGGVVVLHDRTPARVTGGHERRPVERLSRAAVARVELAPGAPIPHLDDVVRWARRSGLRVNVELKHDVAHPLHLVRAVGRALRADPDHRERYLLSSFDPRLVVASAWLVPELPAAWLVHAGQRWARDLRGWGWLGAAAVHPEAVLVTPERVARIHRRGGAVNTWTVNDPARAVALAGMGVDALISDRPGALLAALAPG